ncbi:MAG TPA: phosphatase PAP2 family protein [Pirellulales bacterium]|nr:phosphatase PAP2 family protein [Pirellulales bacterium]
MPENQGLAISVPAALERASRPRSLAWRAEISRDSAVKWGVIAGIAAAGAALCAWRGLSLTPGTLTPPIVYLGLIGLPAIYYYFRREDRFVLCLATLAQTIAFIASFTVLMYALATFARPLCDVQLAAFDAWCGVNVASVRQWTNDHAAFRWVMDAAYGTLLFQLPVIIIVLGLLGDRRSLETFVLQDIVAALLTAAVFAALPADGPFSFYGYEPSPDQAHYLEHFRALRSGDLRTVTLQEAAGLVTFPSFHAAEALLMALAFRHRRGLFAAFGALNLLVALSTMTTGWHYFADVVAGLAVGGFSFWAVQACSPWIYRHEVPGSKFQVPS